jgi:hypothetical protein
MDDRGFRQDGATGKFLRISRCGRISANTAPSLVFSHFHRVNVPSDGKNALLTENSRRDEDLDAF